MRVEAAASSTPSRDGDLAARLEETLVAGDDAFVNAYEALPAAERAAVLMAPAGHRLLERALELDQPASLTSLQSTLRGLPPARARELAPFDDDDEVGRQAWRAHKPRVALRVIEAGEATAIAYAHAFPAARAQQRDLVEVALLPATFYLQNFPDSYDEAVTWLAFTLLSLEDVVAAGSTEVLARFVAEGLVDVETWCRSGKMPVADVVAAVTRGELPASVATESCDVPGATAQAWLQEGRLEAAAYLRALLRHWRADEPLPPDLVTFAQTFSDPGLLHEGLAGATFAYADEATRRSLVLRATAAMFHPAAAFVETAAPRASAATCDVCSEPLDAARPAFAPAACDHGASFCSSCFAEAIRSQEHTHCPYPDCRCDVTPDDLVRAGLSAPSVDAATYRWVNQQLLQTPNFAFCPTSQCPGGAVLQPGEVADVLCRACQHPVRLVLRSLDAARPSNHAHLQTPPASLGAPPPPPPPPHTSAPSAARPPSTARRAPTWLAPFAATLGTSSLARSATKTASATHSTPNVTSRALGSCSTPASTRA